MRDREFVPRRGDLVYTNIGNRAVLSRRKIATQLGGAIIVEAFKVDHKELPKKTD